MILLDPRAHPVVGHRGNRAHSPENTLESIREAIALGVDAIEFDVHVSRDDRLVVIHDRTLERTTNGTGLIRERTLVELKSYDAGARFTIDNGITFPFRNRGVRVPTFDEVIETVPSTLPLIIELKTSAASIPLRDAIRKHAIAGRVIVAGFSAASVAPLRGAGFALGASTPDVATLLLPSLLQRQPRTLPFQALCIPPSHNGIPLPIAAMARAIKRSGTVMHVWTINDPERARALWRVGVQGIISDDPATILRARPT